MNNHLLFRRGEKDRSDFTKDYLNQLQIGILCVYNKKNDEINRNKKTKVNIT